MSTIKRNKLVKKNEKNDIKFYENCKWIGIGLCETSRCYFGVELVCFMEFS